MTIETKTTIEPSDLVALEFECPTCGSNTVRKIDNKFRTPNICGNCSAAWFVNAGPDAQGMEEFVRLLAYYGKTKFPFRLRLQMPNCEKT